MTMCKQRNHKPQLNQLQHFQHRVRDLNFELVYSIIKLSNDLIIKFRRIPNNNTEINYITV